MAGSTSRTSPGNHKVLLATLLCIAAAAAASFLPRSSASTPLVDQTCGRTSNPRLCVSLLESTSSDGSRSATTVRQLAITALRGARRSAVDGRLRAFELSHGPGARRRTTTAADRVRLALAAECAELYFECFRAAALALGRVTHTSPAYGDRVRVAGAVAALRSFPEQCQGLYDARKIVSPLEETNRETQEKLGIASEIVRLLR